MKACGQALTVKGGRLAEIMKVDTNGFVGREGI